MSQYQTAMNSERAQLAAIEDPTLDEKLTLEGLIGTMAVDRTFFAMIIDSLISGGFDTPRKVLNATAEQLAKIPEISLEMADKILEQIRKKRV